MNDGVTTHRLAEPFTTEGGFTFEAPEVAYKTWGTLSPAADNAVLICHALTGHAAADEWMGDLLGEGKLLDPARHFVIATNALGSCYGTTGPRSRNPVTGELYGGAFPHVTIRDMVRLQRRLLDDLGVRRLALVIGGSMGGMQALEWAAMDALEEDEFKGGGPDGQPFVGRLAVLAAGAAHTAWQIGISEAQRSAITADPRWRGGFYPPYDPPRAGLAAARQMAMMTYRSPLLFAERFARTQRGDGTFEIASYLQHQGEKLVQRFDAVTYVRLTEAMDSHDVARDRPGTTIADALAQVTIPAVVVGITSDVLYPPHEQQALGAALPNGIYLELDSPFGHDAFLVDFEKLDALLRSFVHAAAADSVTPGKSAPPARRAADWVAVV
ncbi:MAG: homoserine O-acetyltransferase [Bacteroidota bacterium]